MSAKTPAEKAQELIDYYASLTPQQIFSLVTGISEDEITKLGGLPNGE